MLQKHVSHFIDCSLWPCVWWSLCFMQSPIWHNLWKSYLLNEEQTSILVSIAETFIQLVLCPYMYVSCQLLQFSKNVDGTVNIRWRFLLIWRLFDSFFHMHDVWLVQSSLKMSFWWVNRTPSPFWVVVIFGPFDRFCHHSKSTAEMKRK